jgi:hypothetical protein
MFGLDKTDTLIEIYRQVKHLPREAGTLDQVTKIKPAGGPPQTISAGTRVMIRAWQTQVAVKKVRWTRVDQA